MRGVDNLITFMYRLSSLNVLEPEGHVQACNGIVMITLHCVQHQNKIISDNTTKQRHRSLVMLVYVLILQLGKQISLD